MWVPLVEKGIGVVIYAFHGREILPGHGIDLDLGDTVHVTQQCGDWFYGCTKTRREKKGIFPCCYIQLKSTKSVKFHPDSVLTKSEDPVVKECRAVAREWSEIIKSLYVNGGQSTYEFDALARAIREIIDGRRQLITGTLTQDQIRELKLRLTLKIDSKNRSLVLDLVPRIGYEIANPDEIGAVELYHVHKKSADNADAGRNTVRKKRVLPSQKAVGHHLYCSFKGFSYQLNDDCEVYFSLFDGLRMQFISERFLVKYTYGVSNFVDKLHLHGSTILEDLGFADLHSELYLVAQIVRIGKMSYSESAKRSTQVYKRPFACGVLNIGEIVAPQSIRSENPEEEIRLPPFSSDAEEREFTFKLYTSEEKDFSQIHEYLVKKQSGKMSLLSGSFTIVGLKLLTGDLNTIRQENPILFKNAVTTKKLGFPDIIFPGDVRNDIYVTLEHGEFEKGGKATGKNIEVTLIVLDGDGSVLQNAIYGAVSNPSTGAEEYQSLILYHHNYPRWNETVRISVPIEKFPTAHVRLEYNHCSTKDKNTRKLFGFSFLKLMDEEGTTIKDGPHELLVYKCDDRNKLRDVHNYISLPCLSQVNGHQTIIGNQSFQRNTKESLYVSTLLVSTKLTQNLDLVSILKWRSHPDKIKATLENMANVSGEEIVKFLQDVLDVLFAMFLSEEGESNEFSGDVFLVLVNIFVLLEEGKFEHFKPVIDAYITDHFAAALVYRGLLSTVQHYAEVVPRASKEFYPQIRKCFESLEFLFKLIVQSHILFARATCGEIVDSFSIHVGTLFGALNGMLDAACPQQPDYLPIQTALLQNLSKMYNELLRVMSTVELTRLVCELFNNIPLQDTAHPLAPAKLRALHHLVKSDLFKEKDCRAFILPEVCEHLRHHLLLRQELKLCTEVLDDILIFLFNKSKTANSRIHDDVEIVASTTLEQLVQSVLILERRSQIVGNLVTCLIGLLQLMDQFHYNCIWNTYRDSVRIRERLLRVFLVFRDLIKFDVYPVDWAVMKLVSDSIMLKALHEFSQPLIRYCLHDGSFDDNLWNHYFSLAVTYLTQPGLQLEKFRSGKREAILQRYGDMRVQMGFQILNMWSNLGDYKRWFLPSMVGPFLEMTLVPEMELRKATLNIFYDMLEAEQEFHGEFKNVECELIDNLDMLVSQNKGDDEYRQLFNAIILDRIQDREPSWKSVGICFINSVTRLLERLLDYRSCIQGDENRDKRMSCTVNLLDFYKTEINRQEMYLRYIYKLHDLHLSAENYTEAGFTLLLHAEKLNWTDEALPKQDGIYTAQTEMERKEELYLKILKYFDQGKVWEKGIPLCKELANLYEYKFYNYTKLSQILKTEASFFENILTQLRPEPEFFRVGFFGKGFPLFVRNKEFIYRGLEYERLPNFIQRTLTEWPTGEILSNVPPDESILNSDGQYIQVCNVKPIPDQNNPILRGQAPEKIQAYYTVNNVDAFSFDRRLKKLISLEDSENQNEFKNMWIERTTMRTANPLPGILRWFEVVEKKIDQITPVRYACERIEEVNRQVRCLTNQYSGDSKGMSVNPLSMKLQGILDATVMGGLANYRDAFFTSDFVQNNPDSINHVNRLRALILEQVHILEMGLAIHGKLASPQVQPLHNRLVECFSQMKLNVETDFSRSPSLKVNLRRSDSEGIRDSGRKTHSNSSIINTPLPPVPLELKRTVAAESSSNRSSNSSGYGQMLGNFFEPISDEDDVYSKPNESREYTTLANANSEPSLVAPPPIPNRQRLRILQSSSGTPRNNEYIFMPPNRIRELCIERQNGNCGPVIIGNSASESISGTNIRALDCIVTSNGSPTGDIPNGKGEDCCDGPPLPPRVANSDKKSECENGPPPSLPKRQPKKVSLTPKTSTDSETNPSPPSPLSPSKVGPPVPPKPKPPLAKGTGDFVNELQDLCLTVDELLKPTATTECQDSPEAQDLPDPESSNTNSSPTIRRNPSTVIPHKEFFTLPFEKRSNGKGTE